MRWWTLSPSDWWSIAKTLWHEMRHDSVPLVAAGVSFYAVLGLIPALVIAVSIYGLFTDPAEAESQVEALLDVFPESTAETIATQIEPIASFSPTGLSLGVVFAFLALVWTASSAMRALVRAVVIAYDQEGLRSPLESRLRALGLTLGVVIGGVIVVFAVAVVPALLSSLDPTGAIVTLSNARWFALAAGMFGATALLYRYAPPHRPESWIDVLPGSILATTAWLAISGGFSIYVASFANFNETYGVLGGAVILLLWFFLTSMAVVMGAELNEVLELRSRPPGFGRRAPS